MGSQEGGQEFGMRSERAVKIDKPCRSKTLSCFWLDLESESEVTESKCLGRNRDHTFDHERGKAERVWRIKIR